jgi:hypothetical protein
MDSFELGLYGADHALPLLSERSESAHSFPLGSLAASIDKVQRDFAATVATAKNRKNDIHFKSTRMLNGMGGTNADTCNCLKKLRMTMDISQSVAFIILLLKIDVITLW